MPKLIAAAVAGLVLCGATEAIAGSAADTEILGKDPGETRAFACFVRHYDPAHLKSHPRQNVTDMLVLVDSAYDAAGQSRSYALTLGSNFRGVKKQFQSYGGCSGTIEGQKLSCYIDCDGGAIDVRFKDQNDIVVDIPYGARLEDPDASPNEEPGANVPARANFGADDKTFLLSRAAPASCVDLVGDDGRQALLDAPQ